MDLEEKYNRKEEIFTDYLNKMKAVIRQKASSGSHYKYNMYLLVNPTLVPSVFINDMNSISWKITKFRVGGHYLPIETGRWSRKLRHERLCPSCGTLGDEAHVLFSCSDVDRTGLILPNSIADVWESPYVLELFRRIDRGTKFL